jgi:formylglycine-generating enzyme required for sulfatase activity
MRLVPILLVAVALCAQAPPPTAGSVKINSKDGLKYVYIPPGAFLMGCGASDSDCYADSEGPSHKVTLTRPFWIGQTPVTQQAFQKVTGKNPSAAKGPNRPVESVTWGDAAAYCTAVGGRLPTEAEWEYAARAGNAASRPEPIDQFAWYRGNSGDATHDVAQKRPNAWGLYDMVGNVAQWVNDWATSFTADPQRDPTGKPTGRSRTLRGSGYAYNLKDTRFAYRFLSAPDESEPSVGFRCVAPK